MMESSDGSSVESDEPGINADVPEINGDVPGISRDVPGIIEDVPLSSSPNDQSTVHLDNENITNNNRTPEPENKAVDDDVGQDPENSETTEDNAVRKEADGDVSSDVNQDKDNNNECVSAERPCSLSTSGSFRKKISVLNTDDMDFRMERFPSFTEKSTEDAVTPDEVETPDIEALENEFGWEDDTGSIESTTPEGDSDQVDPIPEYTAEEELSDQRSWRKVTIADKVYKIDMKVIEPYKKVVSHGGYYGDGLNAIIIFASCYLPDKSRRDYSYVMDNLFLYVISTLELLVAEDYMIVYFHGSAPRTRMPTIGWMRRCYQIIDRRLRKNLKGLLLVHPTFWLKTVVLMTKPFISAKFSSKLRFVHSLKELAEVIPMDYIFVPDPVKRYDLLVRKRSAVSSSSPSLATTSSSSR